MEPGAAAAAYAVEYVVEGAAAAALVVKQPTLPLKGRWHQVTLPQVFTRSSHTLSIIKGKGYIFGGAEQAGKHAGNTVHVITLPASANDQIDYKTVQDDQAPPARVDHSAVTIGDRILVFGGAGLDHHPLQEDGRVWMFDTAISKWSHIDPMPDTAFPGPRSGHASTSTEHPLPSLAAQEAGAAHVAPHGSIIIQGGSTSIKSSYVSETWCFDVAAATWSPFPAAPEPARMSSSLTFSQNRIYRYGGFNGEKTLGGQIDYLRLAKSTFDDKGGKGEMAVFPKTDRWESVVAPEQQSPGPRASGGLHPVTTGQGRNYLLYLLGVDFPVEKGDAIDGIYDTVWSYQTQPTGMAGASVKDALREAVGAHTEESSWAPVDLPEFSKTEGHTNRPELRRSFASAHDKDFDGLSVVMHGGIGPDGESKGDCWILTIET